MATKYLSNAPCIHSSVKVWTASSKSESFAYLQEANRQPSCETEERKQTPSPLAGPDDLDSNEAVQAQSKTRDEPNAAAIYAGPVDVPDETDRDPNHDRRKRRKVTPVEASTPPATSTKDDSTAGDNTWFRQLEDAVRESGADDQVTCDSEAMHNSKCYVNEAGGSEETVAPQGQTQTRTTLTTETDLGSAPTSDPSTAKETPEKMPKRPGAALSSTPKRAKKKDATPKTSPRRSARQSRNLVFKNGRLVSSLKLSFPYKSVSKDPAVFGEKIEAILKAPKPEVVANPKPAPAALTTKIQSTNPSKSVHPFFRGKPASKSQVKTDDADTTTKHASEQQGKRTEATTGKPWNEIVFSGPRTSRIKDSDLLSAPWPPRDLHHIGVKESNMTSFGEQEARGLSKQKREVPRIPSNESILDSFANRLIRDLPAVQHLQLPKQWRTYGRALLTAVQSDDRLINDKPYLDGLRHRIRNGQSTFDRGLPAGPSDWTHEYAPRRACDVLQPESIALRSWLEQLKVHHVQSKLSASAGHKRRPPKKKRAKKRADDLGDFLVSSDDETEDERPVKNAIIICGPYGCGKTASVFAAAQELDFEVFEIHPGMRRTAKDIFDKVGDMTHNHLVRAGASAPLSRASSVLSEGQESSEEAQQPDPKQKSLASFVGKKMARSATPNIPRPIDDRKETQKQSLILFEEVDVLFEEDKTFWSGVQSLIATSKRPIVLTCNNLESIPMEDIEVATILRYEQPETEQVVDLLTHVAAAEGHMLDREALRTLYSSRGKDLRAALTDLNFWCQMTIGSTLGGLDWMLHDRQQKLTVDEVGPQRIVSGATFHDGLHLIPEIHLDEEDLLAFAQDSLDLSILEWEDTRVLQLEEDLRPRLKQLEQMELALETKCCMDLMDKSLAPLLSCATSSLHPTMSRSVTRESITRFFLGKPKASYMSRNTLSAAFDPIMEDNRMFPPPTGRTAPSLDGLSTTIATDIAPYIRHIVGLDQQIERLRSEIDESSQGTGRQRRTRAARAALEGGDVSSTRVDRWFPKDLNFEAALATGGQWKATEPVNLGRESLSRASSDGTMSVDDYSLGEVKQYND